MTGVMSRRWIAALGAVAVVAALLALSLASPGRTIGLETDVPTEDPAAQPPGSDADPAAQPPASLPDTGTSLGTSEGSSSQAMILVAMLGGLGVTLGGAGLMAVRQTRRVDKR